MRGRSKNEINRLFKTNIRLITATFVNRMLTAWCISKNIKSWEQMSYLQAWVLGDFFLARSPGGSRQTDVFYCAVIVEAWLSPRLQMTTH